MNPLLQTVLFVVLGTLVVTSGMMGVILLILRLQRDLPDGDIDDSDDQPATLTTQKRPSPVIFLVGDKQVKIHIDVADAPASALRGQA